MRTSRHWSRSCRPAVNASGGDARTRPVVLPLATPPPGRATDTAGWLDRNLRGDRHMAARRSGPRHLMLAGPQARVLQTAFRSVWTGPAAYAHGTGHAAADAECDRPASVRNDRRSCRRRRARRLCRAGVLLLQRRLRPAIRGRPARRADRSNRPGVRNAGPRAGRAVHRPARRRPLRFLRIRVQGSLRRRRGRAGRPPLRPARGRGDAAGGGGRCRQVAPPPIGWPRFSPAGPAAGLVHRRGTRG